MQGGWGGCIAGRCISGAWSKSSLRALKDEALSINLLELVVLAIMLRCARQKKTVPQGAQVVWKCDNISAITNVNNDRANSVAMSEALTIVKEAMSDASITVHGQSNSTEDNSVADKLSRGKTIEAILEATEFFDFEAKAVAVNMRYSTDLPKPDIGALASVPRQNLA